MTEGRKIALVGPRHVGKSSLAQRLVTRGFTRMAIADALKDTYVTLYNVFLEQIGQPPTFTRQQLEQEKELHRLELERFGNRARALDEDYWIRIFIQRVHDFCTASPERSPLIVCDDVRYLNEVAALRQHGFMIVKLVRDEHERQKSIEYSLFVQQCARRGKDYIDMTLQEQLAVNNDVKRELEATLTLPSERELALIDADAALPSTSLASLEKLADMLAYDWSALLLTREPVSRAH